MDKSLVVAVSRDSAEMFAPWRRKVLVQGISFAALALAIALSLFFYQRRQRDHGRLVAAHADEQRRNAERLKLATEAAGVGVWEYDLITGQLVWDDAMFALYGIDRSEFPSIYETWRNSVLPEDLPGAEAALQAAVKLGTLFNVEFRVRRGDGQTRTIKARARVHGDETGKPVRMIGTNEDITRRRAAEDELRRAKEAAEVANVAKGQFLATMSHEIRTPMNGVLGMAQLLMCGDVGTKERIDYARAIYDSGQALLAILNDILDLSKVEAGKIEIERIAFSPARQLLDVAALFAEPANGKGIVLEPLWQGNAARRYRGDPTRLRQVLSNLVGNAIKFSSGGSVRIRGEEVGASGDAVLLGFYVEDGGIGIAPERGHLLFQPFTQLDPSITRRFGGTGLGLSIARGLVRLMGGDIGVESTEGMGSTFWFTVLVEATGDTGDERPGETR